MRKTKLPAARPAEFGLGYLFVAHNLAVGKHNSDMVAVMYLGKIVEIAPAEELYRHPRHPYTQTLLHSAPEPDPSRRKDRLVLSGEVPSPADPPSGCTFHPRCPFAVERCRREVPVLGTKPDLGDKHLVACHLAAEPLDLAGAVREGDKGGRRNW